MSSFFLRTSFECFHLLTYKSMLEVRGVTKTFGDICALEDITFSVEDGEFLFLMGPSGAGKTTLIRLILRDLLPDSGEIFFDDQDLTQIKVSKVPELRQEIGVVFQDFKVIPERTLRENVEIALAVVGLPQDQWESRVDHVLNLVSLTERSELFPSQLSGGELQRVSLARALVVNPKLIIADEPTGNLDWGTADKLMELFKKINEEGKTIIVATHHKLIVDRYADRIIELNEGRIVRDSKEAGKTKKKPKNLTAIEEKEEDEDGVTDKKKMSKKK